MKDWQYDVVFVVGIIGAMVMLFSDPLHIEVRPEVVTLFGVMLAFVYQQRRSNDDNDKHDKNKGGGGDES
jgi:hypothetical protein